MGRHVCYSGNDKKYEVFLEIYKDAPVMAVRKRLNITSAIYQIFFSRATMANLVEGDKPILKNYREPFSENEDDYGTKNKYPLRIETTISELREPTTLELAIKIYKLQRKIYKHGRNSKYAIEIRDICEPVFPVMAYDTECGAPLHEHRAGKKNITS